MIASVRVAGGGRCREAPAVFYSMATASAEDVPRVLASWTSPNRPSESLDIAWVPVGAVRSDEVMKRQRLEITIHREVASRLKLAAARRDLTVRQYVLHAVRDRIHEDLGGADTSRMTPKTDLVLADLWNNRRDAAYDRL